MHRAKSPVSSICAPVIFHCKLNLNGAINALELKKDGSSYMCDCPLITSVLKGGNYSVFICITEFLAHLLL